MKIFTAKQIRKADQFTIEHEPISSLDLMERAATNAFHWIQKKFNTQTTFNVFCGMGNNGGDGLVIARLLNESGYQVSVYEVKLGNRYSADYLANKSRLQQLDIHIQVLESEEAFGNIGNAHVTIDAILGSGLSKPVEGWCGALMEKLNQSVQPKIAIDIASGLFAEDNDENNGIIFQPDYTLTFEFPKLAFMFPENYQNVGELIVIPIGISEEFVLHESTEYFTIEKFTAQLIHQSGSKFDYKGVYGHAFIAAGSLGKMGAAVLASKAALKSGAGWVTTQVPKCGVDILQTAIPEVMVVPDAHDEYLTSHSHLNDTQTLGIGPGIGQDNATKIALKNILDEAKSPVVIDADALNICAEDESTLGTIPSKSILTPHLGEWKRLHPKPSRGAFERLQQAKKFAMTQDVFVILKGAHTAVICPDGEVFFNTTGNPGMASAGSGDVLTGILTGLLAQKYGPKQAAILGVYIHGLAGDLALHTESRESLTAMNIIDHLGQAFKTIA
ncbi:NAD(P)H-hydrate dehydratase [bacterium SCSIO 12643]|nr:NAD(P)H-hydrate dehydratase [bacterium SCSIO 12643]